MRLLVKLIAIFIFGPMILGLLIVLSIVAMIGLPLLWENAISRLTAPPARGSADSA